MALADNLKKQNPRFFTAEMALVTAIIFAGFTLLFTMLTNAGGMGLMVVAGIVFTICLVALVRLMMDPDSVRARQTDEVLKLSSEMLDTLQDGLNMESAQRVCELLLPATAAIAVAITDKETILGYAGQGDSGATPGRAIRTTSTHETIKDGKQRILYTREEIGLPETESEINAAIIMPVYQGRNIEGTLKFYYRRAKHISQTQESMAQGFAELISIQMAAVALEEQTRLATSMELKALQAQINPHFLFNTINTIASFIRTDPAKARTLLREFAVFYRSTLEDADDLIALERELAQVQRYFLFEVARFGEDKLELVVDVPANVQQLLVPSFIVQPLVENAVKHARPTEGKLTVTISGEVTDDNVLIRVVDDGVGMSEEAANGIMHPESSTGLGIAVKNVHDRISGYYGPASHMDVNSVLGEGTTITFVLDRRAVATNQQRAKSAASAVSDAVRVDVEATQAASVGVAVEGVE